MLMRTTVYLDSEELTELMVILLRKQKHLNVSLFIREYIQSYLLKEKMSVGIVRAPSEEKILKAAKKVITYPRDIPKCKHGFVIGVGMCKSCGGIAR